MRAQAASTFPEGVSGRRAARKAGMLRQSSKMIIHLNGWPGTGKQTIGRALAARIRARLIHNHLLHDVAIVCCGRTTPERWELYEKIREPVYEYFADNPVFRDSRNDERIVQREPARGHGMGPRRGISDQPRCPADSRHTAG